MAPARVRSTTASPSGTTSPPPSSTPSSSELAQPWLLGWSFGTDLVLRYGCDPGIEGAILLSPPLRSATDEDLEVWAGVRQAGARLVPEFDDYLRPPEARQRFARIPQARVVGVAGARHLWVGEP